MILQLNMDINSIDINAGMPWFDILDECSALSDGYFSSSDEILPSTPISDSSWPSDVMPLSLLSDRDALFGSACSSDLILPEYASPVESEFGQDADEFNRLPGLIPTHTALVDCHLMPTPDLSSLNWGSVTEATACSSKILSSPEHMVKPNHPCHSLSHLSDIADDENSPPLPDYSSGSSFSMRKPFVESRKRTPARRVKKPSGNTTYADDTPEAASDKSDKAYLRGCHNKVEKNYRNRLNNDFNMLLNVLHDCVDKEELVSTGLTVEGSRSRSKGSILRLARWKLQALQAENRSMASKLNTFGQAWAQSQAVDMSNPLRHGL